MCLKSICSVDWAGGVQFQDTRYAGEDTGSSHVDHGPQGYSSRQDSSLPVGQIQRDSSGSLCSRLRGTTSHITQSLGRWYAHHFCLQYGNPNLDASAHWLLKSQRLFLAAFNFRTAVIQRMEAWYCLCTIPPPLPPFWIALLFWDIQIIVQDARAIIMYEEHVRFMILAEHELSGYSGDNFNSHLNLEQINKVDTCWSAFMTRLTNLSMTSYKPCTCLLPTI